MRLATPVHEVVRFALPFWAKVAVITRGDDRLLELEDRKTFEFRDDRDSVGNSAAGDEAIAELDRLLSEGCNYLLIPAVAFEWVDERPIFKEHLARQYRVVRDEDSCRIVALYQPDSGYLAPAPDGLPVPPPEMTGLVGGHITPKMYYETGQQGVQWITDILRANGSGIDQFEAILDFGCGCGRVIRHWTELTRAQLFGTDYNPYIAEWCSANLGFASFGINALEPPLEYQDQSFDFIYSLSIFTHLDEPLQIPWITELERVLRPGGLILLTFHGQTRLEDLEPEEIQAFESGQLVVRRAAFSGSSMCATWHPERYVRGTLARDLKVLDYSPGGALDCQQDAVLFRKP